MINKNISDGVAHKVPDDLKNAILSNDKALIAWEDISPLARNEWICWTISVKQQDTRTNHIKRTVSELSEGIRRPCCWMGCAHRSDKPINNTQKWLLEKRK